MIVRAAIMFSNGVVIEGHDYSQITTIANKLGLSGERILGFVTGTEDFVLPREAATIAFQAKQIKKVLDELKPQDLWPGLD